MLQRIINFYFVVLLFSSCYSSTITYTWKNKNLATKKYTKVLIIALVNHDDLSLRKNMENHLCDDLKEKGINAVSSLNEYGPQSFKDKDEKSVVNKLEKTGFDAVITIVLLNKEKEKYYVPGRVYYSPYTIYHQRFWGYYSTMYDRIYEPGYYSENTSYFWESNFFDAESKELIYTAQTKSFNPSNSNTLANEYGKLICKDLFENKILQ